jgi:hypothetical protein
MKKLGLLVVGLLLVFAPMGHGQSEAEAGGLLMENRQEPEKSVVIGKGYELRVTTYENGLYYTVYKGRLTAVTDSSLMLDGLELPFSKIQRVAITKGTTKGSVLGGKIGITTGLIGILVSFILGLLSVVFLAESGGCGQVFAALLLLLLAFLLGITAVVLVLIGLIFYAAGNQVGRAFRMDGRKWKIRKEAGG